MTQPVEPPALLTGLPPAPLGALLPPLRRLAALQGAWPVRPPALPRALDPSARGTAQEGRALADAWVDEGVDLVLAEPDTDPVAGVTALAAVLDLEPVLALGTAGGGGAAWADRLTRLRAALPAARQARRDVDALLDVLDDPALSLLTGLLEQAARRRTPLLVGSGATAVAALLLADRRTPGVSAWALAGSTSSVPGVERALIALGLEPVLDLRLPGPGGATLAGAVLAAAQDLLAPGSGPARG